MTWMKRCTIFFSCCKQDALGKKAEDLKGRKLSNVSRSFSWIGYPLNFSYLHSLCFLQNMILFVLCGTEGGAAWGFVSCTKIKQLLGLFWLIWICQRLFQNRHEESVQKDSQKPQQKKPKIGKIKGKHYFKAQMGKLPPNFWQLCD